MTNRFVREVKVDSGSAVTVYIIDTVTKEYVGRLWYPSCVIFENHKALGKRLKKAHKWADGHIKVLEQGGIT